MADRVCILYDSRCAQSVIAARYCRWMIQFVLGLGAETFDTSAQRVPVLQGDNTPSYTAALILSIIDGVDRLTDADWARLQAANGHVPFFTFYKAAAVIARNPVAAELFGPVSAADLEDVTVTPAQLTYSEPAIASAALRMANPKQAEPLVAIKKVPSGDGGNTLVARLGERIVAFRRGTNVFEGQLRVAVPRSRYPFDNGRAGLYLRQFIGLARQFRPSCAPPVRSVWPVCIRIDDPPASWWLLRRGETILQADDYRRLLDILDEFDAKLTVMCVPAMPRGRGFVPWWEWTRQFDGIFEQLRRGVASGRIEIGCHGLTHLTIGCTPPSRLREWLGRRRNPQHNPTREFYDDLRRQAIPVEAQWEHIRTSVALLSKFFGCRIRSFTPGAHNWSDDTERALARAGLEFLAADCGFEGFAPGGNFCKNPSPLGERATTDQSLLYVSRLLAWPTEAPDVECLHDLGIPLTISTHNYGSTMLRPERLKSLLTLLQQRSGRRYFTVSELGDLCLADARAATGGGTAVQPARE